MHEIVKLLAGDFVVVDLGAASTTLHFNKKISKALTLIELDAVSTSEIDKSKYFDRIIINTGVSGKPERRTFYKRKWIQCSSVLEPDDEVVSSYGMSDDFELQETLEFQCESLSSLLKSLEINRVDFLKTDLEGLDYEILASSPEIVSKCLCIQSELRFQPFYIGEPYFHQTTAYLTELGFELINMRPEVWKYATPNRNLSRDGRLCWADAIFFLSPKKIKEVFKENYLTAILKQIIIAKSIGLNNYAEYLYEIEKTNFYGTIREEIKQLLKAGLTLETLLILLVNNIVLIPGMDRILNRLRLLLLALAKVTTISRKHKHFGSL